jgi:cysteine synthase
MAHIGILESNLSGSGFAGLRVARELGGRVTFFTRDLQRYLDVPGARRYFDDYVDDIVICETNELAPVLAAVREASRDAAFDAFLTMGEYDVVVAAQVAEYLGLPTVSAKAAAVARNKVWMRERCAEHEVPMPAFRVVTGPGEAQDAARELGLPCVVKPADETSSADVLRCTTLAEVAGHVRRIQAKPENTRGQRRFPGLLVEQNLAGHEVSVEVLAEGEDLYPLGVTDKALTGVNTFVEAGHVFPSLLPAPVVARCAEAACAALRATGFGLGLAHVELKVTADGPMLIEINPRPAGGKITELVDRGLGISCLELVVRQYLGESVGKGLRTAPAAGTAIRYLTGAPGRVESVTGTAAAAQMPGVIEAVVSVRPGDEVRAPRRNGDRIGHVLAVAADSYQADRIAAAAAHEIAVVTTPGASSAPSAPGASSAAARPVADSLPGLIGLTPLIRLKLPEIPDGTEVLAKLEMSNPLSSVKDRTALFMLRGAERRGLLAPGTGTIIEATSGNTGISLAALAAAEGYRCVIVLPDSATAERIAILRALGAEVVLTPRADGYPGAIARAVELHEATPGSWFPCQHENPDNVAAHYETTGPEIWADCQGRVDLFVCGVGTGGTLSGIARYLKECDPAVRVVAVEPEKSPVLSRGYGGLHGIPGLNGGFVAPTTDVQRIDEVLTVSDEQAAQAARRLARGCGVFAGISSGAAVHACLELAARPEHHGKRLVTVLPDTGERYLTIWQQAGDAP